MRSYNFCPIKRIKLILTGGGTRGAYQIGAIKALQEMGLWDQIASISGCSIGSINAALIMQYPEEECYKLWQEIGHGEVFKGIDQFAPNYYVKLAKASIFEDGVNINPFIAFFKTHISEEKIRENKRELIISAYNIDKRQQEYHNLREIPRGQLIEYLIASSRLPFFQPVIINGDRYADGGVGDNEPYYSDMDDKHFDLVISIKIMYIPYYIPGIRTKNISFDNKITIAPSRPIGNPLSFESPTFKEKYKMGYEDACLILNYY